ncbi:efflux RND transporter periplasmic adaptor subunit [Borrelia sp. HM]|uniref:efflux RND transporter periplasmic adaptor subunit n=1 Tax=Borrelia sp. HM TaxID=1882662 RepID=UPI001C77E1D7|nr:efflux RND transporter periplasmic adaptor subunit [Borrelia sp. HM]BCR21584.1 Multidrug resistance protein MdtA [Borrelia sp. HM]
MYFIFNIRFYLKHFLFFLILLSLLLDFSCSKNAINDGLQEDISIPSNSNKSSNKFPVILIKAQRGILSNYLTLNGDIDTKVKSEVFPSVMGKIVSLNIKLGDYVKKGQVIAVLDPSKPGSFYLKSSVITPISGYVLSVNCKIEETVRPQKSIALIGKIDTIQIKTHISEKYVLDVKVGSDAVIELQSYPNEKFKAKVSEVSPILDFKSRTAAVYLEPIGNNKNKMIIGMFAKIKLITNHLKNAVKIPRRAFVEREGKLCVFKLNKAKKTVERVFPIIDFEVDDIASIKEGVNADDLIVIEGISSLSDGVGVDIVDIQDGLAVEDNV